MRISRQWNLSKHAAVVGTSGGANMMFWLKWWRVHAISSNSESGCTGSYMPGIMPCCRDCDYTLLFWRLQIWYLCFQGSHHYILDPYYSHTPMFPVPPTLSGHPCAAKEHGWASWNGNQNVYTLLPKAGPVSPLEDVPKPPRFTVCDGSGSLRVRFFATDGESQEWVLVILTVGFPQFWWIFLRSLGWFSLGLEYRLKFVPVEPLLCDFPNTRRRQSRALPMEVGSDALERCTSDVADTPGHSPHGKCVSCHPPKSNQTYPKMTRIQGLHGPLPYPVSMIDLVWICRGTGVMVSSEIEDFQYVLIFV